MLLCIKSNPFLFLIPSTLFLLCHGTSQLDHLPPTNIQGIVFEGAGGVVSWGMRRSLLDGNNIELAENHSLILAAKRTHRRDPLDDFQYYKGGWNISEGHYLSSAAFTATPLLLVAAIWFLGFGMCLLVICVRRCCCRRQQYGYSRIAYAFSLVFLILFTIAAIIGCVVLYTGQGKFHSSTTNTLEYVVEQADNTVEKLKTASTYFAAAKQVGVDQIFLPPSSQNNIDGVDKKINKSIITLEEETHENSKDIQNVLNSVRLALIIIAAVMLLLAFLGFLFSVLGMQCVVYILEVIGWILVTVTFILCGVFLFLHNVVGDTCVAMDEWVQHPTAHTALDDILPCVDYATAQETLFQSKDVTFQLVGVVNQFINNVSNINIPLKIPSLYYNQSGPLVPVLCNPLNSDKTNRQCTPDEVNFTNAAQEWSKYLCQVSENGICTTVGRLTPAFYDQMMATVNVSYALHHYSPILVGLGDCTFVRETFGTIIKVHCPGLRRYSKWIYIGLIMVSAAVMLSLVFWVFYARERRHRGYTKQIIATSVEDHSGGDKGM